MDLREWMVENAIEDMDELLEYVAEICREDEGVVPALCHHGCQVEPDEHCPHGGESLLIAVEVM